ncbi:MAG: alpha-ketoacid dehydrogenase subunit beta [Burkholderiales bacterium]|nr:alpha-ketoacid dehydrogenase subunit beta [Burkholderiales bacterium]
MTGATYAEAARDALAAAMASDPHVVVLGEDVGRGGIFGQYAGLQARFGAERVIDTPISEATIAGAGVGMALAGCRPVVELRVVDFALCAMDEIVNQAAKNRYMFGGQGRVPMVIRMPIGIWTASAAQHSQSLEAWFAHLPGLVVTAPATAADNAALLRQAIDADDPVVHLEHKELWGQRDDDETAAAAQAVPARVGHARIVRRGADLTIVSWSRQLLWAREAAGLLAAEGVDAELIELGTLWPWDRDTVLDSAARTGRLLVTHEAVQVAGFGAEVAASAAEATGCRVRRAGAPRIPVGYASTLEEASRVRPAAIAAAARELLR